MVLLHKGASLIFQQTGVIYYDKKKSQKNSDFFKKLFPGDIVSAIRRFFLADRGFDITDCIGTLGAELKIPAFIKSKN